MLTNEFIALSPTFGCNNADITIDNVTLKFGTEILIKRKINSVSEHKVVTELYAVENRNILF